jgi:osmotically-inducible protein OsmY
VNKGSVWVMIQRRWVYLQGCVPNAALAKKLERAARALPDVETVVPDLMVGTRGKPPYPLAAK